MLRHARGNCFCLLFCSTNWYMLLTCMCYSLMFKDLPAGCWMPKNNEQQHPGLSKQNFLSRCILALEFAEIRTRFYGDNTAFHLNSFTCLITFLLLVILAPWGQNVTVSCNRKRFFNNAVPNWGKTHKKKSTQRECLVNILNLFVKD